MKPIMMAHTEDDLPMTTKQVCARCNSECWLGPRLSELHAKSPESFDVFCQPCTIQTNVESGGKGVVCHMGNPLS